jgi:hypothetical protein
MGACCRELWLRWRFWFWRAPAAPQPPAAPPRDTTRPTTAPAAAQPARSPRNASYTISARLDPASRTLKGEQLPDWRNIAKIPATTLQFHLYYNAWRNTRSTWIRERLLAGDESILDRRDSDWGWIDVTSVRLVGSTGMPEDVTSRLRFIAPDDGNAEDRTVAELPLAAPVAPGATVNVQIAWSSRVPRTFARTARSATITSQWFPKTAFSRRR